MFEDITKINKIKIDHRDLSKEKRIEGVKKVLKNTEYLDDMLKNTNNFIPEMNILLFYIENGYITTKDYYQGVKC